MKKHEWHQFQSKQFREKARNLIIDWHKFLKLNYPNGNTYDDIIYNADVNNYTPNTDDEIFVSNLAKQSLATNLKILRRSGYEYPFLTQVRLVKFKNQTE